MEFIRESYHTLKFKTKRITGFQVIVPGCSSPKLSIVRESGVIDKGKYVSLTKKLSSIFKSCRSNVTKIVKQLKKNQNTLEVD